jgi:hypothetical protein
MNNAQKLATLCTQDTGRRTPKQKHNTENQTDEQHRPHQKQGGETRRMRRASSYKTPAMLLI